MPRITARHLDGDRFEVAVRGHRLVVDQPTPGGDDAGPTPVELFVAGLTACVAALAGRYLARHALTTDGLQVVAEYATTGHPSRVAQVRLVVTVPPGLSVARRRGLVAVSSHCTVHNSLTTPPEIEVTLAEDA